MNTDQTIISDSINLLSDNRLVTSEYLTIKSNILEKKN